VLAAAATVVLVRVTVVSPSPELGRPSSAAGLFFSLPCFFTCLSVTSCLLFSFWLGARVVESLCFPPPCPPAPSWPEAMEALLR